MSSEHHTRAVLVIAIASLICPTATARAQEKNPREVQPERPTVATHAHTVAPGYAELESGFEYDRAGDGSKTLLLPNTLKIGLGSHLQLNLSPTWSRTTAGGMTSSGLGDFTVALKWRLLDDAPVLGDFALLPTLKLATGSESEGTGTGTTDGTLTLISSHNVGSASVDINAAYTRRSGDGGNVPTSATFWTIASGIPLAGRFGLQAELYGYPGTSGPSGARPLVAVLTGPTAQIVEMLAVDAGIIIPIRGEQPHAIYAGFVYNFGKLPGMAAFRPR
ncbi:MAG: transporter [Gemmatimonadota bacterium]|nr:transporter [Gemmatimonadota bacterium]